MCGRNVLSHSSTLVTDVHLKKLKKWFWTRVFVNHSARNRKEKENKLFDHSGSPQRIERP